MLTMTLENVHNFSLECLTTFSPVPFSYNSPSHSFFYVCQISIHCFVIELQYNPYDIKLYIILHIKSLHHSFEDIVNVNRL